jgi:hypothetical protein
VGEGGRNGTLKDISSDFGYSFPRHAVERRAFRTRCQSANRDERARSSIRSQGFACDEPQKATRDAKMSKPDYDVWVLTCKNATYRIGRYPDLAAKVEKLK